MLANQKLVIPTGAAIAGSYGPNVAPANTGPGGALALSGASRVAGPEHTPEMVLDDRHCRWVNTDKNGVRKQCGSWPIKDRDRNPNGYCAGHLKKATNGADTPGDQGLRT